MPLLLHPELRVESLVHHGHVATLALGGEDFREKGEPTLKHEEVRKGQGRVALRVEASVVATDVAKQARGALAAELAVQHHLRRERL